MDLKEKHTSTGDHSRLNGRAGTAPACCSTPAPPLLTAHIASPLQVAILQTRIAQNQYDVQAWDLLIDELWAEVQGVPAHLLRQPGLLDRLIEALHSVVSLFPTAVRPLKSPPVTL